MGKLLFPPLKSFYLKINLSVCLSVCLSVNQSINQSINTELNKEILHVTSFCVCHARF